MQCIEDKLRLRLRSHQEIESGKNAAKSHTGCCIDDLTTILGSAEVGALDKELHAILQVIVERNLSNGGIDRYLQLRPIDLIQCSLDDAVAFLVGIDQQVVVDGIRGNSHIGKKWCGCAGRCSA